MKKILRNYRARYTYQKKAREKEHQEFNAIVYRATNELNRLDNSLTINFPLAVTREIRTAIADVIRTLHTPY